MGSFFLTDSIGKTSMDAYILLLFRVLLKSLKLIRLNSANISKAGKAIFSLLPLDSLIDYPF